MFFNKIGSITLFERQNIREINSLVTKTLHKK